MSTSNNPVAARKLSAHATSATRGRPIHGRTWVVNAGASPYRVRFVEESRPGGPRKARFFDVSTNKTVLSLNGPATAPDWPDGPVLHELLRLTDPHADLGDLPRLARLRWLVNATPTGFTLGLQAAGITPWPARLPLPNDAELAGRIAKKLMRAMTDPTGPDHATLRAALAP